MKTEEFYRRAKEDPLFRGEQIVAARDLKRTAVMCGVAMAVGWAGYAIYCLVLQDRWPGEVGAGIGLVLCASVYAQAATRLAALAVLK